MSLLEQIHSLGDDALIGWERLVADTHSEVLSLERLRIDVGDYHDNIPEVYTAILEPAPLYMTVPTVTYKGRFIATYVAELKQWFPRYPDEQGYEPMQQRVWDALQALKEQHV